MTHEKLRLSVGAAPGQRAFAAVVGVLLTGFGAAFVLLPVVANRLLGRLTGVGDPFPSYEDARDLPPGMLPPELRDGPAAGDGLGAARLVGLCGVPFVLLGLYLLLRILRTAAWLDGTRASVRGALVTRTVDLATADVSGGTTPWRATEHAAVRTVIARDPAGGRRLAIPLQGMGLATLPPYELRALADAITAARPADGRHADAHALAGQLRAMAANPLGL